MEIRHYGLVKTVFINPDLNQLFPAISGGTIFVEKKRQIKIMKKFWKSITLESILVTLFYRPLIKLYDDPGYENLERYGDSEEKHNPVRRSDVFSQRKKRLRNGSDLA
jgi:hypothetical protein